MIGICVANKDEWIYTIEYFRDYIKSIEHSIYGEYTIIDYRNNKIVLYNSGTRKVVSSSCTQYMIDKFDLKKVIVVGTCAGVNRKYKCLDIVIPDKLVQYDCTVREVEPLIKERYNVDYINFTDKCILGTSDKPLVMWNDYLVLKKNNIDVVDTEAAGIAYICKLNNVESIVIKGISDFPKKENKNTVIKTYKEQYNIFIKNIPIIMNKIFKEYLDKYI